MNEKNKLEVINAPTVGRAMACSGSSPGVGRGLKFSGASPPRARGSHPSRITPLKNLAVLTREEQFDAGIIFCRHHPDRIANRSDFVRNGSRRCGSCKTDHRRDGTRRPASVRHVRKQDYNKMMRARVRGGMNLSGRLHGLALFERATGLSLSSLPIFK